jgi:Tfp pilus assembly PilM family ATPase
MVQHTVVSLPTTTASAIAENLWQLGYACQAIDGLPCIHARAACLAERGPSAETLGVLDWGATTPMLTVVSRGRPVFTRVLRDCGLAAAMQATAKRIGFESDELHELLTATGRAHEFGPLATARSGEILRDLSDRCLQRLEGELQRTLRFLRRQGNELVPGRLLLIGGGAMLPRVDERLSEIAQTPTALWRLHGGRNDRERGDPMQAVFASAIALSTLGASA